MILSCTGAGLTSVATQQRHLVKFVEKLLQSPIYSDILSVNMERSFVHAGKRFLMKVSSMIINTAST